MEIPLELKVFGYAHVIIFVLLRIDSLQVLSKHLNVMDLKVKRRYQESKYYEASLEDTSNISEGFQVCVGLPIAPMVDFSQIEVNLEDSLRKGPRLRPGPIKPFYDVNVRQFSLNLHDA